MVKNKIKLNEFAYWKFVHSFWSLGIEIIIRYLTECADGIRKTSHLIFLSHFSPALLPELQTYHIIWPNCKMRVSNDALSGPETYKKALTPVPLSQTITFRPLPSMSTFYFNCPSLLGPLSTSFCNKVGLQCRVRRLETGTKEAKPNASFSCGLLVVNLCEIHGTEEIQLPAPAVVVLCC